jgi:DNA-binding PadR family transcriptional regulator
MSADVKLPSGKEIVVLELLVSRHELYGLQMVTACPRKLARGTIYVTLNRMEDKGFVKSRQVREPGASGLPKRLYSATALGRRAYLAWQQAQLAWDNKLAVIGTS